MMRPIVMGLTVGMLLAGAWCAGARGDGGTVRLSERKSNYQITVFTAPTPVRAGPLDISVLVQDTATLQPLLEVQVTVQLALQGKPTQALRSAATTEAATNKLLHAAVFELPKPGWYEVEVEVAGEQSAARVRFAVEAATPLSQWLALWPWIGWPALAIVAFGIHQWLVRRDNRPGFRRLRPGAFFQKERGKPQVESSEPQDD